MDLILRVPQKIYIWDKKIYIFNQKSTNYISYISQIIYKIRVKVLHALGVQHEHSRPDRDEHIIFYPGNTNSPGSYTKMTHSSWITVPSAYGGEFELDSVMTYASTASSSNNQPVTVVKSNHATFVGGKRITTMDALQIQYRYCPSVAQHNTVPSKPHSSCPSVDAMGFNRLIFDDRICDGRSDCNGGEDEDGTLATCIEAQARTANGCCGTLIVDGAECIATGIYDNKDYFVCDGDENHVIHAFWLGWAAANTGIPVNGKVHYYAAASQTGTCPPTGTWDKFGTTSVLCKSSGYDNTDDCEDNSCGDNATCMDGINRPGFYYFFYSDYFVEKFCLEL